MLYNFPYYEVLKGSHKLNITSTKWWLNWLVNYVFGAKIVGRDNLFREVTLSDFCSKLIILFSQK